MALTLDNGMQHLSSPFSVPETLMRVKSLLLERGLTIFCIIDHSSEAEKVGLKMPPYSAHPFWQSQGRTPVTLAAPTIAIDLALKALIWEDAGGKVWVSFNSPEYLRQRHNVPADFLKNISAAGPILQQALE
ncbi:MAG TPA: DUF302 domain-containing protein [Candidatus Acidoferrum sp.]|nr:DUF302 domain-containing protein [Candidatus Acidoferrum sp.]